ncbi:MAG: hypothetical protein U0P45_16000, partial [Acidimicrobiales bacterium]
MAAALVATVAVHGPPASAAPTLTVPTTTVAVGATIGFTATECAGQPGTQGPNIYQSIYAWVIAGTGADARAGEFAKKVPGSNDQYQVTVQGWVDPDQPATLVVWCVRADFSTPDATYEVVHDYGDTPLDITAPSSPAPSFAITASRTTASTGQVVVVQGTGCKPGAKALVGLRSGTDLTLRTNILQDSVMVYAVDADAAGKVRVEVELNRNYGEPGSDAYAPLPTGPYTIVAGCEGTPGASAAAPLPLDVPTANPVDSLTFSAEAGTVTATGEGCTDGRKALVTFVGAWGPDEHVVATPAADGTWSARHVDATSYVVVRATCGDPLATGFRYL